MSSQIQKKKRKERWNGGRIMPKGIHNRVNSKLCPWKGPGPFTTVAVVRSRKGQVPWLHTVAAAALKK